VSSPDSRPIQRQWIYVELTSIIIYDPLTKVWKELTVTVRQLLQV